MKRIFRKQFIVGILLVFITQIYASAILKQRLVTEKGTNNDANKSERMDDLVHAMTNIPVVGSYLWSSYVLVEGTATITDKITHGLVTNLLNSIQPCTIYIEKGIKCKGITEKGLFGIVEDVVNGISPSILPEFGKGLILKMIESSSNTILG